MMLFLGDINIIHQGDGESCEKLRKNYKIFL